jgi:predicted DCC family thiol-disulfide oxidoreductase YuxK
MSNDGGAIIVFDGVCVLCSGWVHFLLRHDRRGRFRFAAMQSASGRELLAGHGLDPDDPNSFLLLDGDGAWKDSLGVSRVLQGLGGLWRLPAAAIRMTPRPLRDWGYRLIARNRYQWFGRKDVCLMPTPEHAGRFLS